MLAATDALTVEFKTSIENNKMENSSVSKLYTTN